MANELQAIISSTGLTLYAVLINGVGQVWNTAGTPSWESYNAANWADYDIALTEAGAGIYLGDMPAVVAGAYSYAVYSQAGASPATTDTLKGTGYIVWDGSAEISAANANVSTISGDSVAADNLEAALDGTGGVTLTLKKLLVSNSDTDGVAVELLSADGVAVSVIGKDAAEILSATGGGAVIYIVSPSYGGHADYGLRFEGVFDTAAVSKSDITTPMLKGGSEVIYGNITGNLSGSIGSLATQAKQDTRDAMKLAPTAGDPAAGSIDAHLDLAALEATLTAIKGAGWTTQTLVALDTLIDAIKAKTDLLDVSSITVTTPVSGSTITITRGDTLSASIANIGALTGYVTLYFTVKSDLDDDDDDAIIMIKKNASGLSDGLIYLNSEAASSGALGNIAITDEPTGDITISLAASATDDLSPATLTYDIQMVTASAVTTLTTGVLKIVRDVTKAVS